MTCTYILKPIQNICIYFNKYKSLSPYFGNNGFVCDKYLIFSAVLGKLQCQFPDRKLHWLVCLGFARFYTFPITTAKKTWICLRLIYILTHWGWMMYICISKLTIIGSDNGLSPGQLKAIIWTNAGILLIWTLGMNFSEILSKIHAFTLKKMDLSMKWRPFCLSLYVLIITYLFSFRKTLGCCECRDWNRCHKEPKH